MPEEPSVPPAALPSQSTNANGNFFDREALARAFAQIENIPVAVNSFAISEAVRQDILQWGRGAVPPNRTEVTFGPSEYVGAFPIRQDISVLPATPPSDLRIGWRVYEEIGVAYYNSDAVSRINISTDPPETAEEAAARELTDRVTAFESRVAKLLPKPSLYDGPEPDIWDEV